MKATPSRISTPRADQGRRVGEDVARRVDVAVTRRVRRAEGTPRRHGRVQLVELAAGRATGRRGRAPAASRSGRAPAVTSGVGEAGHAVALLDEPGVQRRGSSRWRAVEVLGPHAQPDGGLGAALRAHHAGRAAARPLAERPRLEQDDPLQPGPPEEPRAPRADGAAADDHGVGAPRIAGAGGHRLRRWHRLNSQSRGVAGSAHAPPDRGRPRDPGDRPRRSPTS